MANETRKYISNDNLKYTLRQLKTKLDNTYTTKEYVEATTEDLIDRLADGIKLRDQRTGFEYKLEIMDGVLVTSISQIKSITILKMPNKVEYYDGDAFDPEGLELLVTFADDSTLTLTEYDELTFEPQIMLDSTASVIVTYDGFRAAIPVTATVFDPVTALQDFEYTYNGDGTYTITDWKGTTHGVPGNEIIIPNIEKIKL